MDIRADQPKESDVFWLDTNVLIKLAYAKYPAARLPDYPRFLKQALGRKSTLQITGLVQAEMIHVIEKAELETYNLANGTTLTLKEFRHDYALERAAVVSEIEVAWDIASTIAVIQPISIDATATVHAMDAIKTAALDGYDLFQADLMFAGGQNKMLSDDGDFATMDGIILFTANTRVIRAARAAGKLVTR